MKEMKDLAKLKQCMSRYRLLFNYVLASLVFLTALVYLDFGSIKVFASDSDIVFDLSKPVAVHGKFKAEAKGLYWESELRDITFQADVGKAGDYALEIIYQAEESVNEVIQLKATLKFGAEKKGVFLELARPVSYGAIRTDSNGDQIRPVCKISQRENKLIYRLKNNVSNDPYRLALPAGKIQLTLEGIRTDFRLNGLRLVAYPSYQTYSDLRNSKRYREAAPYNGSSLYFQAEHLTASSSASLGSMYSRSDPLLQPVSPEKMLLNIAGGLNYSNDGQWMEWELDVPQDGLYLLDFKARQSYKSGLSVNRRIYIDGRLPFKAAQNLAFPYASDWQFISLKDEKGNPAQIFLTKGKHSLTMEVVPGPEAAVIVGLTDLVSELTDTYRSIMMITGINPDHNRDYFIERDLPDLHGRLKKIKERLVMQRNCLENSAAGQGAGSDSSRKKDGDTHSGEATAITSLEVQLDSFLKKPDSIPARLGNFKSNIDALSAFMLNISNQPLDLDYIMLRSPAGKVPMANGNFWQKLCFESKALLASFIPKKNDSKDGLTVWVAAGREQLQVIKDMADNEYSGKIGKKKINFSLVQQGITEAILAGNSPDVVLYVPNGEIVNLAMRGALFPLDDNAAFKKLKTECQSQAFRPYYYQNRCFGLPLTQSFPLMFIRTDIFTELGLKIPQTWDDLYALIPNIQRKNMQVGIPSGDSSFATMLWQRGQSYYSDNLEHTDFNNQTAIEVFHQYTRLFTDYDLPVAYDFYNRFRSGEMPLALADYTEYNRLLLAAPEITGKWTVYPIPGNESSGRIDNSVQALSGLGTYVLNSSKHKSEAADFVFWFASARQQAEYGKKTEDLLGAIGRYAPANQVAFASLPWLPKEQNVILSQWNKVKEQAQMPGSYYTARNLTNAFRATVYDRINYRESLLKYAAEIDRELERKREEYRGRGYSK